MNPFYILVLIPLFGVAWIVIPFGIRRMSERRLARLCRAQRAVVLSYDDGSGRVLTGRLLDLLSEMQVRATFFMLGRNALANPEMAHRVFQEGHEVGSHTREHSNAWKVAPWRAARDMRAGIAVVREIGAKGDLFRPPYGKLTLMTLLDKVLLGQRLGWWTIDPKDTRDRQGRHDPEDVLNRIHAAGGGVVLMHDFDKEGNDLEAGEHADYVVSLTRQIIDFAHRNNYEIRTLGDVLKGGRQ